MLIKRKWATQQLGYYPIRLSSSVVVANGAATGYHRRSSLVTNWLSLALYRYEYVLSRFHPNRAAISMVVKPGFSLIKVASCRCAGLVKLICRYLSRCCLFNIIDWRSPLLPRLQAQQDVTKLSGLSVPPSAKETLWSTSSCTFGALCPQYWQVKESLANICHRSLYQPFKSILFGILTLYSTRGAKASTMMYVLYCKERGI